jgi:predicted DNA binding protein
MRSVAAKRTGHARLTRQQVEALRAPSNRGRSVRALAREIGISPGTVSDVLAGRTWRHLPVPL